MDIESAELRLKTMDHSEQHYFNRSVFLSLIPWDPSRVTLTLVFLVTITMVSLHAHGLLPVLLAGNWLTQTPIKESTRKCWYVLEEAANVP